MGTVSLDEVSAPSGRSPGRPDTPRDELEAVIAALRDKAGEWAELPVADRRAILREMQRDLLAVSAPWAERMAEHEGHPPGTSRAGEEWLTGPYMVMRNLRLLDQALGDLEQEGAPRIPGPVRRRPDGRTTARVFPTDLWDRIFYPGVTAEVWMEDGVEPDGVAATQGVAYDEPRTAGVALVLGGGNVSSIGPMDTLYKLFVENRVVLYKAHPVNEFLGPLLERAFQALVDWGVFRVVYGGAEVGAFLCAHDGIDEIHVTGSDRTVEAIAFGPGEEGRRRKAEGRPLLTKPISSELGNVSPVIVVPGPWTDADLDYQAESLASMLVNNAGFNCNAARVLVQHAGWEHRRELLDRVGRVFEKTPTRRAWYPGAEDRYRSFLEAHPEARQWGSAADGKLPWTLIPDVDPEAEEDIVFRTEAFASVFAETALEAGSTAEFLSRAVEFANRRLWGTLNATIVIHPESLAEPGVRAAFERALEDLRYGTIALNAWAATGYGLVVTPWGAPPGHTLDDIQSGTGVVHNTLMFSRVAKTVVRAPFRMFPKPIWFPTHRTTLPLARRLTSFEAGPSPLALPGIFWEALRG